MRKNIFPAFATALLLSVSGAAMALPMYTITDLGFLGGYGYSSANAINDNGQVVGVATNAVNSERAFFWDAARGMIDLGVLRQDDEEYKDYKESEAFGINNHGQVVGYSEGPNGKDRAFLWDSVNGMIDLGTLPGENPSEREVILFFESRAYGINNHGQVVGSSDPADGRHAFLWDSVNGMIDLGIRPTYVREGEDGVSVRQASTAYGISDSGYVVGSFSPVTDPTNLHGFLWDSNGVTDIGSFEGQPVPGTNERTRTFGRDVNNQGQVVGTGGWYADPGAFLWDSVNGFVDLGTTFGGAALGINNSGQVVGRRDRIGYHSAVLWDDGVTMVDLNDLLVDPDGWHLWEATSINESGQIVGVGDRNGLLTGPRSLDGLGDARAFLLTPVDAGPPPPPPPPPPPEAIAPGVHPDREEIIDPSGLQGGTLFDSAAFTARGQSMWDSGDALFSFDRQYAIGPDVAFDETLGSHDSLITASLSGGFKAQLETGLTISSGFLDVDYGYDVGVDYSFDPVTGDLRIATTAHNPRGNLNTTAPDIAFEFGFGFDAVAAFRADAHILGQTIPLGAVNLAHFETGFSLGGGGLVGNADHCFVGTNPGSGEPNTGCDLVTPYGSLSLNQLPQSPDISAQADLAGLIIGHVDTASIMAGNGGGDSQTDILSGSLDLDALGLLLAGLPPDLLGGDHYSTLEGVWSAHSSYDVIDADLNVGLGLGQDVSFIPHLMAEFTINGRSVTLPVGESFTVNVGQNTRNIFLNANYILDNTFTNTVSLAGTLNADATFGAFSAELDIVIPGFPDAHFDIEETLYEYQSPSYEGNLFSLFDNSFRVTGFNSPSSNWVIDVPDHEAASVSNFAGAPASTGQLATDGTVDWQVDGTAFFEGGQIVLQTNSPTLVYTNLSIPVDVVAMTFDFMAITTVSGDVLKLYFGDIELFSLTGDMFGTDWMRTDFIDISTYAGMTGLLTIALLSPDGIHSEMLIDNIFFYDTMADIVGRVSSVPEPGTMFLLGAGLLTIFRTRRKWAA